MLNINGTQFLICIPRTDQQNVPPPPSSTDLAFGLGFGLGLPFLLAFVVFLRCYCHDPRIKLSRRQHNTANARTAAIHIEVEGAYTIARQELTSEALRDLRDGTLSDTLMEELMILRIKKGQNLTNYIEYAQTRELQEMANWITNLNPGAIPREIHEKARSLTDLNRSPSPLFLSRPKEAFPPKLSI